MRVNEECDAVDIFAITESLNWNYTLLLRSTTIIDPAKTNTKRKLLEKFASKVSPMLNYTMNHQNVSTTIGSWTNDSGKNGSGRNGSGRSGTGRNCSR